MSRQPLLMSLCLANAIFGSSATAFAEGVRPKIAIIDGIELPERMEATRAQLRDLLEDSVRKRGFDLIRSGNSIACSDANCLAELAKASGATDVLLTRGGKNESHGYHVELSLWDAATGETVPAVADCTVCSGPQMADSVAQAAGPLLDRVGVRASAPAVPPAAVPPVPPALGSPSVPSASGTLEPASGHRILGWSLVAAGGAAAVGGGILWSLDGKGTDCLGSSCRSTYRTEGEGIALLVSGLVAAGIGVWLVLDSPHHGIAMMFGPSGATLAGRF